MTGALAVATLAVLLAAGLGLLGGRTGSPLSNVPASAVADVPSPAATSSAPPAIPRVTPWAPCSGPPAQPPEPVLEVDGEQYFGQVELDDAVGEVDDGSPAVIGSDTLGDPVDVPMDAVAEIWIPGGSCAIAWSIGLADRAGSEMQLLESVPNDGRDPAVAAQNRFQVFVAPYAGERLLRATFVLEHVSVRATWFIRVRALEAPHVSLRAAGRQIPMATGCDVTQRLANRWEQPLNRCARDVVRPPVRQIDVAPNERLDFEIEGWAASNTTAYCGQMDDRQFVPRTEPPCLLQRDPHVVGVSIPAPDELGPWTLAISGCATRIRVTGRGFEELCGTWYANVRVRE